MHSTASLATQQRLDQPVCPPLILFGKQPSTSQFIVVWETTASRSSVPLASPSTASPFVACLQWRQARENFYHF